MNVFQKCFVVAIACFTSSIAMAQDGAEVIRNQFELAYFEWDGGDVLAVVATDMYFWCGDEEYTEPYEWMAVIRPDGTPKIHERGHLFTRVFQPATPDDFWGDGDPCPFIEGGPMVAEGISHFTYNDNDGIGGHPNRQNVWGYTLSGTLYDIVGSCPDDMVDLTIIRKFRWEKGCNSDPETCIIPRVIKGPELNCP